VSKEPLKAPNHRLTETLLNKTMAKLTEQEQQEVLRFIEAGKPLPDKYRFLLFDEMHSVVDQESASLIQLYRCVSVLNDPSHEAIRAWAGVIA